jgi:hypothetical protein
VATAAVLHWDGEGGLGAIIRGDVSYGLLADTGSFPNANGKYVLATLDKVTKKASFSLVPLSDGVPSLVDTETSTQIVIAVTSTSPPQGGINNICYVRQSNSIELEGALIRNLTVTGNQVIGGTLVIGSTSTINGVTASTLTGNVNSALNTANTANSMAGTALGTANTALSAANSAANTGSNAYNIATLAFSHADMAVGTANDASGRVTAWQKPGYTLIDGNKIFTGDAYVDTLQIQGEAVTIPVSTYIAGPMYWSSADIVAQGWVYIPIVSLSINTHIRNELSLEPKPILILLSFQGSVGNDYIGAPSFYIRRESIETGEGINIYTNPTWYENGKRFIQMVDLPPAGAYRYSYCCLAWRSLTASFQDVCLTLLSVKR